MQRLSSLSNQLSQKSDDDIVIVYSKRTPLTKSKKGALKDTSCEMMLFHLLKDIRTVIDPSKVDDIIVGNVLQVGSGIA